MSAVVNDHSGQLPLAVFATERSERLQQLALAAAPPTIRVVMIRNPDRETLKAHLNDARYLISERAGVIDMGIIEAAPALELILRIGSFTHDIDLEAARRAEIAVCRLPVPGAGRVAEHVVLQMLALARRLGEAQGTVIRGWKQTSRRTDENTFAFNWSGMTGLATVAGSTVGVLGFGEIGAELSRRLSGWECTVLYHKRRRLPPAVEADLRISYSDENSLIERSDFLVNLLPYSSRNDMRLGRGAIAAMKHGAFLLSCGSGAVIDEAAAAQAIESGKLSGVALDTYEWEPVATNHPLVKLARSGANVVLTPHIAGGDKAGAAKERREYFTNIENHLSGKPLRFRLV